MDVEAAVSFEPVFGDGWVFMCRIVIHKWQDRAGRGPCGFPGGSIFLDK